MNLTKEIRITKKNLADAYKGMRRWIQDPESYVMNSCGDERENQITHAVYEFGRLQVLRKLKKEENKLEDK